jgi:hypothetical protein
VNRFPPEWLALREPVDVESRSTEVLDACAKAFDGHEALSICDLGAGTGASVRAFAHLLPNRQRWTLVDHDATNLKCAIDSLARWGKATARKADETVFERAGRHIEAQTLECNLITDTALWPAHTELVTASALLDLTSADWITRIVNTLSAQRLSFLATLNFDGRLQANPAHELDDRVFEAFRKHQYTDKGFGAASGTDAADVLEAALDSVGYAAISGDSPWRMTLDTQKLMHETLRGISEAAIDIGAVPERIAKGWLDDRLSHTESLVVGHRDIFAAPKLFT